MIRAGHVLAGSETPAPAKNGARFSFKFPGSLQGFSVKSGAPAELHPLEIGNVEGHSREGRRSLPIGFRRLAPGRNHDETILAAEQFAWELDRPYALELRLHDTDITVFIDGKEAFSIRDEDAAVRRRGWTRCRCRIDCYPGRAYFSNLRDHNVSQQSQPV